MHAPHPAIIFFPGSRRLAPTTTPPIVAPPAAPAPWEPPRVTYIATPNFWKGRPSGAPIALVIHTTDCRLEVAESWFRNPASLVSSHDIAGLAGELDHVVGYPDRAWANGILEPGNRWPGSSLVNPNDLTVSIETEDAGNALQEVTEAEYQAVLYASRAALRGYPAMRYLLGHCTISPASRPNCPGPRWVQSGQFGRLAAELMLVPIL